MVTLNQARMEFRIVTMAPLLFSCLKQRRLKHTPVGHVGVSSLSLLPSFKSCLIPGRGTDEERQRRRSHMLNRSQTSVQSWHNIGQFKHPLSQFETEWHSPVITSFRLKTSSPFETSGFFSIKKLKKLVPTKKMKLCTSNLVTLGQIMFKLSCRFVLSYDVLRILCHFHGLRSYLQPWWSHIMVLCALKNTQPWY